jgi:patatin-like phospholipase/acyl hydrolase
MAPYRVLSFDGGGVSGVFTAVLLDRLSAEVPHFITRADLLAGSSAGGIIALGLAAGVRPSDIITFHRDDSSAVFDDSWIRHIRDLGGLIGAKYDNANLKNLLENVLGAETTLAQLSKRVLIPAFQLDNLRRPPISGEIRRWKPKFFHNFPGPGSDGRELAVDVAMRTSAAPTFFPVYQGYIDGGLVDNSPSLCALAQALDPDTGKQSLADIRLLSIGTGLNPAYIEGETLNWGEAQWAKPTVTLLCDGILGPADYLCVRLLGPHFHRLNSVFPEVVAPDDHHKVKDLISYASAVDLSETVAWLKQYF